MVKILGQPDLLFDAKHLLITFTTFLMCCNFLFVFPPEKRTSHKMCKDRILKSFRVMKYVGKESTHTPGTLRAIPSGLLNRLAKLT